MPHITPAHFLQHQVMIHLVGCGGNGSQMLTGLARLNHALTALGHPGLNVIAFDPDTVSEANMGRQMFGQFDVGSSKAIVLVSRINAFFGLNWEAHFGRYEAGKGAPDMLAMNTDNTKIKIFKIDDWAYVAAATEQNACDFIAIDAARPDDPEAWECSEMTRGKHADLEALLAAHIENGGTFPDLIGIDAHYQ